MSANFWLNLISALLALGLGLLVIRSWKLGILRRWRARGLRRRLSPLIEQLLMQLASAEDVPIVNSLIFLRQREEIESIYRRSRVLLDEERVALAEFLSSLSRFSGQQNIEPLSQSAQREDLILKGQRLMHDMREFGY